MNKIRLSGSLIEKYIRSILDNKTSYTVSV